MIARRSHIPPVVLTLAVLALAAVPAKAQSGSDIMNRAMAAQTERLAGVENITITQTTMGMAMVVYMEKREMGGTPTLVPVSMSMGGTVTPVPQEMAEGDWSNPFQEAWAGRTRLEGEEDLDGRTVKVLVIDDFSGLELPGLPGSAGSGSDFEAKHMRFWMDEDELVMRKMEMEAETRQEDGSMAPIQMAMFLDDYREVDGYLHPFVTRVITKGVMEAANVDQAEVQAQLAELRKQLEDMPAAQRAMMEGMLSSQIEMLEEMMGGDEGMEVTMTVTELKVNAGPPGGG